MQVLEAKVWLLHINTGSRQHHQEQGWKRHSRCVINYWTHYKRLPLFRRRYTSRYRHWATNPHKRSWRWYPKNCFVTDISLRVQRRSLACWRNQQRFPLFCYGESLESTWKSVSNKQCAIVRHDARPGLNQRYSRTSRQQLCCNIPSKKMDDDELKAFFFSRDNLEYMLHQSIEMRSPWFTFLSSLKSQTLRGSCTHTLRQYQCLKKCGKLSAKATGNLKTKNIGIWIVLLWIH